MTIMNCEGCGAVFNGRLEYQRRGTCHCPKCGFLVYASPLIERYKKSRIEKGFAPLPIIPMEEWKRYQHEGAYEKKWKEEEKKKEERG